jgi:poly(3-hydroxybutyrate) depolymerase
VDPALPYQQALVRAWREAREAAREHPFLLDNVWDLQRLLDYLTQARADVDPARIGVTGYSLGGMHSWLLAAADERVAAAAPMAGVQHFGWAVAHGKYQGRVDSIPAVFAAAAADMGRPTADEEVVAAVWRRLLPCMQERYDAPASLPLVAPRPLLITNGAVDPRCPQEASPGQQHSAAVGRASLAHACYSV